MPNFNRDRLQFIVWVLVGVTLLLGTPRRSAGQHTEPSSNNQSIVVGQKVPELIGRPEDWINTDGKVIHLYGKNGYSFAGHVIVVCFWTTGCINCRRTLPYWSDWAKRYGNSNDFAVVTIHTPETPGEKRPAVVRHFAQQHHLTFPILVDSDEKNWDAFGIQSWPTTLLIDKQGKIRGRWEGELNFDNSGLFHEVEAQIEQLRHE